MPNMANGNETSPERITKREKAAAALQLRLEGHTFVSIAEKCGYKSYQAAFDAVKRAIDRITREPAEAYLKLELERLDAMWQLPYLNAQAGDIMALNACIRIMERRAKLIGLDAPPPPPREPDPEDVAGIYQKLQEFKRQAIASTNGTDREAAKVAENERKPDQPQS